MRSLINATVETTQETMADFFNIKVTDKRPLANIVQLLQRRTLSSSSSNSWTPERHAQQAIELFRDGESEFFPPHRRAEIAQ